MIHAKFFRTSISLLRFIFKTVPIFVYEGVDISIRGRYTKPREDGTVVQGNDRPLHLYISGLSKTNLER